MFAAEPRLSPAGSSSPPASPGPPSNGEAEQKFVPSPTKLGDQKPFRGFDITSLIRKDDDDDKVRSPPGSPRKLGRVSPCAGSPSTPSSSPNVSLGPPQSPPSNPYTNLFNSGLYQQYLGQLLAGAGGAGGGPAINPMLLQAQLAMAAQNNIHNNSALLASYQERLKQSRYSPYPAPGGLTSHQAGIASAFKALGGGGLGKGGGGMSPRSPPVSPPHSASPPALAPPSPNSLKSDPPPAQTSPARSDIKNIENMINGLNGTSEGRFSLSHADSRLS